MAAAVLAFVARKQTASIVLNVLSRMQGASSLPPESVVLLKLTLRVIAERQDAVSDLANLIGDILGE